MGDLLLETPASHVEIGDYVWCAGAARRVWNVQRDLDVMRIRIDLETFGPLDVPYHSTVVVEVLS